ncbi:MAG: hypothetical protein AAFS07_19120, partial [Pseudomonadota bacterium]
MAHRVRVRREKTFALNPQCTQPYNADFDGDEMNMHVLQSIPARAEAAELMAVGRNLVSPQNHNPTIGMIQDAIMGLWILTRKDRFLGRGQAMQLVCALRSTYPLPAPAILRPEPLWTGKQIFSLLLPPDMAPAATAVFTDPRRGGGDPLPQEPNREKDAPNRVAVAAGELVHGRLSKKSLGGRPGGFIDYFTRYVGSAAAIAFISDAQRLAVCMLQYASFTTGYGDMVLPPAVGAVVGAQVAAARRAGPASLVPRQEQRVLHRISQAVNRAGAAACDHIARKGNGLWEMVLSGSKGSAINIVQITSAVGVQMAGGQRIFAAGDPSRRTLPCFAPDDHSPAAHGFVGSSYHRGLSPQELFMHVKAGREGLVDTAVRTADTGSMSRRVAKFMESTISDAKGRIVLIDGPLIQPLYGGDGYDPSRVERVACPALGCSDAAIRQHCARLGAARCHAEWCVRCVREMRRGQLRHATTLRKKVVVPVNVLHLLQRHGGPGRPWLDEFDRVVGRILPRDQVRVVTAGHDTFVHTPIDPFRLHLLWEAGPTMPAAVLQECLRFFLRARLPTGYSPGIIAAQSMSQLVTQSTLNTFHHTGQAHTLVNTGITRFIELLNATHDIATPTTTLELYPNLRFLAPRLAASLPYV